MGSSVDKIAGNSSGYGQFASRVRNYALNNSGAGVPTIADLVGGVNRHLNGQRAYQPGLTGTPMSAYQAPPYGTNPNNVPGPTMPPPQPAYRMLPGDTNYGPASVNAGVSRTLQLRDAALSGTPVAAGGLAAVRGDQPAVPNISNLVGMVNTNLGNAGRAMTDQPGLMGPGVNAGLNGQASISDLIRMVRQVRGLG